MFYMRIVIRNKFIAHLKSIHKVSTNLKCGVVWDNNISECGNVVNTFQGLKKHMTNCLNKHKSLELSAIKCVSEQNNDNVSDIREKKSVFNDVNQTIEQITNFMNTLNIPILAMNALFLLFNIRKLMKI